MKNEFRYGGAGYLEGRLWDENGQPMISQKTSSPLEERTAREIMKVITSLPEDVHRMTKLLLDRNFLTIDSLWKDWHEQGKDFRQDTPLREWIIGQRKEMEEQVELVQKGLMRENYLQLPMICQWSPVRRTLKIAGMQHRQYVKRLSGAIRADAEHWARMVAPQESDD